MMENAEIIKTTIGDIIEKYSEKSKNDKNVTTVYSISSEFGLIASIEYWKKRGSENRKSYKMFSDDTSNYNIVRKNMFAYNQGYLNRGSIDCLLNEEAVLVSPLYKIFKIKKNIILPKYLLYFLKTSTVINKIDSLKETGARKRFDFEKWKKIEINIPPLKKQAEIVEILDKFTELTKELTKELTAREAQYEYYRNMLLSKEWIEKEENKEVEWKALEKIFDTRTGYTPSKKIKSYWENGTVDWFTVEDINQKGRNLETANTKISEDGVKGEIFKGNSVVLSTIASVGKFALIKNDFLINQQFTVFTLKKEFSNFLNMEFAKHYFSQISEYCLKNVRKANITTVDKSKILKLKFPIPSLKTQQKIIDILDNFETLVKDIRQGLPREIELRQKQYEYYREKLLTFE